MSGEDNKCVPPRVVVAQIGARHHYAVPRMLEKSGHLTAFYTDANAVRGLGRLLTSIPLLRSRGAFNKLSQRKLDGVAPGKIWHTDALLWRRILGSFGLGPGYENYVADDHLFDELVASRCYGDADTLYAMQKHGVKMLAAAQDAGVRTVVDVFITPMCHHIVEEERARYPDIEAPLTDRSRLELEDERTRQEIDHADLLLCPGMNVVEGLAHFANSAGKAYAVVPYGCGVSFDGLKNDPVKGRVLFAGTADLRKGIHYLGMAAEKLAANNYDFRVAGNVTEAVRSHPLMSNLHFLGRVPRAEMREEFLKADVFVLPTLAEGCASVVHEAVMAGCPVITTGASGTMVENGRGGMIVPEKDPDALADAIASVVEDRGRREELATSCAALSGELTEDSWSARLLAALNDPAPAKIPFDITELIAKSA
ncbi:MAG: glycosyltransferase family 4 protein [Akkermansiaceae bacterium]